MKLLFLLPSLPCPPASGARIRNLGLISLATRRHQVDAIAFGRPDDRTENLDRLVRRAWLVPEPPARSTAARLAGMFGSPLPDVAQRRWSPAFARQLQEALASERYDAVQAEGIEMARYLHLATRDAGSRPRLVYDAHNAELLLQRRAFESALGARDLRRVPAAAYSLVQWRRLERFEGRVVRGSDLTLAVSYHDANQLSALAGPRARVRVVTNGIDVARYPYREPCATDDPNLLFLGTLDYRPNAEALAWFLARVFPSLQLPRVRLFVVGHNPPAWLVRMGQRDDRIAVVGPVDDERPYLARGAALVLPLLVGGGSRLKALVAFASGLPVVSTRLGMEGLDVEPGEDFVRADRPDEWAEALARLLGTHAERRRIAANARSRVERTYDWHAIAPTLDAAYASLE